MKRMDYDETTEDLAKEYGRGLNEPKLAAFDYRAGRNRARESLAIALRALEYYESFKWRHVFQRWPFTRSDVVSRRATEVLAEITKRGDFIPEGKG